MIGRARAGVHNAHLKLGWLLSLEGLLHMSSFSSMYILFGLFWFSLDWYVWQGIWYVFTLPQTSSLFDLVWFCCVKLSLIIACFAVLWLAGVVVLGGAHVKVGQSIWAQTPWWQIDWGWVGCCGSFEKDFCKMLWFLEIALVIWGSYIVLTF